MTEKTKENYSIIEKLVEKYFGLDAKSIARFKDTLHNPFIDETFKGLDEDLRFSIPFDNANIAIIDKGWEMFQEYFKVFVKENEIDYASFRDNLFKRGKSKLRLFKNLTEDLKNGFKDKSAGVKHFYRCYYDDFYSSRITENQETFIKRVDEVLNRIGTMKVPSTAGLKFVISLNFADWFLCSSGEKWKSCLGLDSDYDACYWSGLAGTVVDKNRALFYITDSTEKNFEGIRTDHLISRSWVLLGSKDELRWLRFYPNEIVNPKNAKTLLAGTPFAEMREINSGSSFRSKHPLDLLRYTSGITSFIFQDKTTFDKDVNGNIFIINESNGFSGFNEKNEEVDDNMIECGTTLRSLIKDKESISRYFIETVLCDSCGCRITEDEATYHNDTFFCNECFNEQFYSCNNCGTIVSINNKSSNHHLCSECYDLYFSHCTHCGIEVKKTKGKETKKKWKCVKCSKKKKEEEIT